MSRTRQRSAILSRQCSLYRPATPPPWVQPRRRLLRPVCRVREPRQSWMSPGLKGHSVQPRALSQGLCASVKLRPSMASSSPISPSSRPLPNRGRQAAINCSRVSGGKTFHAVASRERSSFSSCQVKPSTASMDAHPRRPDTHPPTHTHHNTETQRHRNSHTSPFRPTTHTTLARH